MTITVKDLTCGEVEGTGLYDELMRTTKAHLKQELDAGNITPQNYATVYLGALEANLQAAANFVLQQDINNQKILLLQEQVRQAQKQNDLLDKQLAEADIKNQTAQYQLDNLVPEQFATQKEQTKLVTAQVAQANAQVTLLGTQNSVTSADSVAKINNLAKQDLLVDEKIKTEKTNTVNPTAGLAYKQFMKSQAEIDLLNQKKATEDAQTVGTLDVNGKSSIGGLVGREMELKHKQAEAFTRDAEQKAAKIMSDTFSIIFSTDQDAITNQGDWGLGSGNSKEAINKMLVSIGCTPVP